jgi:signal transduction histidine kinase
LLVQKNIRNTSDFLKDFQNLPVEQSARQLKWSGGQQEIIAIETTDRSNKRSKRGKDPMQCRADSANYPSPVTGMASPDALARLLLSETSAAQSRLAAALSHELNSPIGALNSSLDTMSLILRKHQDQPEQAAKLGEDFFLMKQVAQQSCQRLIEIVSRMQRFTSLERVQIQRADVNELLRDAIALLQPELDPKVEVTVDLDELRPLDCKPRQLCAVFLELLRNAVAHLQGTGEIRVRSSESGDQITIQISHNGRAVNPGHLPNVFEPTFAVKDGRVVTSNWALFSSRTVVLDHGGYIEIESAEGKGTCVTIGLPHTTRSQTKEDSSMNAPFVASKQSSKQLQQETAAYFGLAVEVIVRMSSCSLVRYGNREFVVETADLQETLALGQAA